MGAFPDIRKNKFYQEAYSAGVEEGMEKGMEKGMESGEVAMLLRLLETKFGALPDWARARIEMANRAMIEQMGLRLLTATRLEDVFTDQSNGSNGLN